MSKVPRERYEPPAIERVQFAPGELAAASCKKTKTVYNQCRDGVTVGPRYGS